jgi:16S rRNA (adenine1518-N6/adenine1519-N6)-dimethyltransferase
MGVTREPPASGDPPPPTPAAPGRLLRSLEARPNKRLSQSFLKDLGVAQAMVRAGGLTPSDTVLEIGPGLGLLTRLLVQAAGQVVCVEVDHRLATSLPYSIGAPANLQIVEADALSLDLSTVVSQPYRVVASLPYHIATPILFKLAFRPPRPSRIVAMVQEEVAQRIAPPPGALTYLGAALGVVARARIVRRVPPGAFYPPPKVRSAVIQLDLTEQPTVDVDSVDGFVQFLRTGFTQPRKQLHNSLAQGLGRPASEVHSLVKAADLDPSLRPGQLTLQQWANLYRTFQPPALAE